MAHSGARLVLSDLKVPCQEQHDDKIVSGIVKNIPFAAHFKMEGEYNHYEVDFHRFKLKCVVLYDCEEEKEVHCVKSAPAIWSSQVNETGEAAVLNIRLMVLSSQHEDLFFRIKFIAIPPQHSPYLPLQVLSGPIRVVSKHQQLKPIGTIPPVKASRKRPRPSSPISTTAASSADKRVPPTKRGKIDKVDKTSKEFFTHLQGMIAAFNCLPVDERHTKLKEAIKGDCTDLLFQLNTIADVLVKCTADIYCSQELPDDSMLMQAPLDAQSFDTDSIPNLDELSSPNSASFACVSPFGGSGQVCANPEGLFSSWDFEEKKDFEQEAIEPSTISFISPCPLQQQQLLQAYEPNPLTDSQDVLAKLAEFGLVPKEDLQQQPNSTPIPNLDYLIPTTPIQNDCFSFFTPFDGYQGGL